MSEAIEVTLEVTEVLDTLKIRYLIAGSLAGSVYGNPRSTRDTDILADIRSEHIKKLCEHLQNAFNISEESIDYAIRHRSSFNVIHYATVFKVDIFLPSGREFDEVELQRRVLQPLGINVKEEAYFATPEDVILAKLDWYRQGNEVAKQQWHDVICIAAANKSRLDLAYMNKMAAQLDVLDLVTQLLER